MSNLHYAISQHGCLHSLALFNFATANYNFSRIIIFVSGTLVSLLSNIEFFSCLLIFTQVLMSKFTFFYYEPFLTDFQLESGFLSERYSSIFIYLQSLFNYSFHGQLVISILEPFSTDFQLESAFLFE